MAMPAESMSRMIIASEAVPRDRALPRGRIAALLRLRQAHQFGDERLLLLGVSSAWNQSYTIAPVTIMRPVSRQASCRSASSHF